ncbi:conserved hypothetical protein [Coccidioides posadasii str. Silveira]|uniref:Protein kinase domain-containing protein n=1 Tax=Coccidioides posadasii (strain RMSCC 757 / Silveira) TaxID=443226 RepID=E9DEM7_COCPS|nr:conserved hypothetical protein [Coccidioides posadasii str. Silveira]
MANSTANHPGRTVIPIIQDQLEVLDPNGCHTCYVTSQPVIPKRSLPFPSDIWTLACAMWSILGSFFDGTLASRNDIASQNTDLLRLSSFPTFEWYTWRGMSQIF